MNYTSLMSIEIYQSSLSTNHNSMKKGEIQNKINLNNASVYY